MNVWTVIATMLWVIPMFWLIRDLEGVVDNIKHLTGHKDALVRLASVLVVLLWPVAMIIDMMLGDEE